MLNCEFLGLRSFFVLLTVYFKHIVWFILDAQ